MVKSVHSSMHSTKLTKNNLQVEAHGTAGGCRVVVVEPSFAAAVAVVAELATMLASAKMVQYLAELVVGHFR